MQKIILLGAGYANLSLIKSLNEYSLDNAEFILVNNNSYHYKTTELHKIAAKEEGKNIKIELNKILPAKVKFIQDEVISIQEDKIICKNNELSYDKVVVALGANKNTFGISGLDECYEISDYEKALLTQKTIYENIQKDEQSYKNIVICGAGFSGIELCASLAIMLKNQANIYIVEAMDEILPMYPKSLAQVARKYLESLGVNILSSHKIIKKEGDKLFLNDENNFIVSKNIIFTAGVKGNEVINNSFMASKNNRVLVNKFLQCEENKNCYIIGDCSLIMNKERPFAPTAQIACKQGEYLANCINKILLNNENEIKEFNYIDKGSVCSLSNQNAIAYILDKEFSGFSAKLLKKFTEIKWNFKLEGFKSLF